MAGGSRSQASDSGCHPVNRTRTKCADADRPVPLTEEFMTPRRAFNIRWAAVLALLLPLSVLAAQAQYGTEAQAKAMLTRAVAAMKQNTTKALEMFNKGEGGFKDRDLYVFCANALDDAHGTSVPEGRASAGHRGQERLPAREGDHAGPPRKGRSSSSPTGGLAPVPTSPSRSTPSTRRSPVRTAAWATTRNDDARPALSAGDAGERPQQECAETTYALGGVLHAEEDDRHRRRADAQHEQGDEHLA